MEILSNLPERLQELMLDRGVNASQLAKELGVSQSTINRYLEGIRVPNFNTLISLVEYFDCSADFLLGLGNYPKRENQVFKKTPPFSLQFRKAMQDCGVSQYALQKKTNLSWSNFNDWLHGRSRPFSDSLVKLARGLDCSIDFLLGRET